MSPNIKMKIANYFESSDNTTACEAHLNYRESHEIEKYTRKLKGDN